jgi:hypothetical protein
VSTAGEKRRRRGRARARAGERARAQVVRRKRRFQRLVG